jgi:hypothetical protein
MSVSLVEPFFLLLLLFFLWALAFALAFALDRKVLTWKGGVGCLKPDRGGTKYPAHPYTLIRGQRMFKDCVRLLLRLLIRTTGV